MGFKNFMEQVAAKKLDDMLQGRTDICTCEQCRTEMLTYALNHLPPRYISSHKGEIFGKIDEMDTQTNADISKALVTAIKVVSSNPRHTK